MPIRVSYIVSAYNSTLHLPCLMASFAVQSQQDFEVIVTDNSTDAHAADLIRAAALTCPGTFPVRYLHTKALTCYHSAELGAAEAVGDYLCFPSDDNYYMPKFHQRMLEAVAGHELALCEMVYDERIGGSYSLLNVEPRMGKVDKGGFLLHRSRFQGFPGKPEVSDTPANCDGELIDSLMAQGLRWRKINDILVVHN